MVKCPAGHALRVVKSKAGKVCDTCNTDFVEGDEAHRCAPCDFDCCASCFSKASSVAKTSSGDGVKKQLFGKTRGSGAASASGGPGTVTSIPKSILKTPPRELRVEQTAAVPPPVPGLPGMVAVHDLTAAGQNPFLAQEFADEEDEVELNSKAMLESLEVQTPPAPDGVDAKFYNAMGTLLDAKLAPVSTGLQQLNAAVSDLQQNAVHKKEFANLTVEVERIRIGCEQEFARSTEMASTLTSLSRNSVIHDDRIGALETQFRNVNVNGKGKEQEWFRRRVQPHCLHQVERCDGPRGSSRSDVRFHGKALPEGRCQQGWGHPPRLVQGQDAHHDAGRLRGVCVLRHPRLRPCED